VLVPALSWGLGPSFSYGISQKAAEKKHVGVYVHTSVRIWYNVLTNEVRIL